MHHDSYLTVQAASAPLRAQAGGTCTICTAVASEVAFTIEHAVQSAKHRLPNTRLLLQNMHMMVGVGSLGMHQPRPACYQTNSRNKRDLVRHKVQHAENDALVATM